MLWEEERKKNEIQGLNHVRSSTFKADKDRQVEPEILFDYILIIHTLLIMHLAAYLRHLHVLYTDTPLQTMQLATPETPRDPPDSGSMHLICEQ